MAKKAGAPQKQLQSYLVAGATGGTSMSDYLIAPAVAFLRQTCEAYDAFEHCKNKFTIKIDGTYNKDSEDSLRQLSLAITATVLGHFETYQKALFAGTFELSRHFTTFDLKGAVKALGGPVLDIVRLAAFRGSTAPVGMSLADSLDKWHSAETVNSRFSALGIKQQVFSNGDILCLNVLWQLRHSIVHTGAFLTLPDSKKVPQLSSFGDTPIVFEHTFIDAMSRRLHKLVKGANQRLKTGITDLVGPSPSGTVTTELSDFLHVASPKPVWLK